LKKNYPKKNSVTIHDIAKLVNISASTVSRALNNHPRISQKTKERIWATARNLGYKSSLPVYMESRKNKIICFMVPDLNTGFYTDAIKSIQNIFEKKGYSLFIASTNNSLETEKMYSKLLIDLNVNGVIVALFDKSSNINHLESLLKQKIPTVFINKTKHTSESCKIIPDISHGSYKAIHHFISMNCKDIAVFTGDLNKPFFADIVDGYSNAMKEAGLTDYGEKVFSGSLERESIYKYLDDFYKNSRIPEAILSPDTKVSNHIITWLKEKNMNIPDDMLLISFSNDQNSFNQYTSLSTIRFSGNEIGKIAAEKLFQQIENEKITNETIIIPPKLIIKNSSL
jgi:LacI family transcriptional regulator